MRVVREAFESLFRDLSSTTDEQAEPYGLNECWLLPAELGDSTVSARTVSDKRYNVL